MKRTLIGHPRGGEEMAWLHLDESNFHSESLTQAHGEGVPAARHSGTG